MILTSLVLALVMFFHRKFTRRTAGAFQLNGYNFRKIQKSLLLVTLTIIAVFSAFLPMRALAADDNAPVAKTISKFNGQTTKNVTVNADGSTTTTTTVITDDRATDNPKRGTTTGVDSDGVITITKVTPNGDGTTTTVTVTTPKGNEKSSSETETPSVEIRPWKSADKVTVGKPFSAELVAEIKGVKPDSDVLLEWGMPIVKFKKNRPENPDEWDQVFESGDFDVNLQVTGPGTAIQSWTLKTEGFYSLKNIVTATFQVNGQEMILHSK